jgi:hypothetical protein
MFFACLLSCRPFYLLSRVFRDRFLYLWTAFFSCKCHISLSIYKSLAKLTSLLVKTSPNHSLNGSPLWEFGGSGSVEKGLLDHFHPTEEGV